MAKRRMFALAVVDTDIFLDMPLSAQGLYFHLGMRADDDGFVSSPKKIMRACGANDDDLKLLVLKRFVHLFTEDKVLVINHWKMNNLIKNDRYTPSIYRSLFTSLTEDDQKVYHFAERQQTLELPTVKSNGTQVEPQVRLGKVSIGNNINARTLAYPEDFERFWKLYPKKVGKFKSVVEWKKLKISESELKTILEHLAKRVETTWIKEECRYVIHPERFIKNRLWEDDLSQYAPLADQGTENENKLLDFTK